MKKITLTLISILILVVSIITVSAEESSAPKVTSVQTGANEITIEGNFNVTADNSEVSVYVFKTNKTVDDLEVGEDGTSTLIYQGQTASDSNGSFEFAFVMNEDIISGWYNAMVGGGDPFEIVKYSFYYKSEGDILRASKGFADAADDEDYNAFTNTFNTYSEVLGIGQIVSGVEIDENSICEVLYDYYTSNTIDKDDADKCIEIIQYCEVLAAVYDNKITDLFDYSVFFGIEESRVKGFLSAPYVTEQFKQNVTKKVALAGVENPVKVIDEIYEQFVLEAVREPVSYTNLKTLLCEFAAELGVTASDITDKACNAVATESYNDWTALGKAIISGNGNSGNYGGPSGGSSGSSGGGGTSRPTVSTVNNEVVVPEKLPTTIFDDLGSVIWAEDAIVYLAEKGILNGKGDNKFCPNDSITREEFAKILTLVFFADSETAQISFADVPADAWYYKPVSVAYSTGIIKGKSETLFGTGECIIRQDAAVMACRAAEKAGLWTTAESSNVEEFFDDDEIDEYAKEAVYNLYDKKVINGKGNGEFSPKAQMTRAEAAKIIYALLNA